MWSPNAESLVIEEGDKMKNMDSIMTSDVATKGLDSALHRGPQAQGILGTWPTNYKLIYFHYYTFISSLNQVSLHTIAQII